jgi:NIPSNAP
MVAYMLRDYRVKAGEMEEWLREWGTKVRPLRERLGFDVVGAWTIGEDRFVWILAYEGDDGEFQRADKAYYDSKERKTMQPDPARHLSETRHWRMTEVLTPLVSERPE